MNTIREQVDKKILKVYNDIAGRGTTVQSELFNIYDVLNECYMMIMEKGENWLEEHLDIIDKYFMKMVKYSIISKTSKFYYKYIKNDSRTVPFTDNIDFPEEEDVADEALTEKLNRALKKANLSDYDNYVLMSYLDGNCSWDRLSEKMKVNRSSLYHRYNSAIKKIRKNIEE